jgi:hypothetical protein
LLACLLACLQPCSLQPCSPVLFCLPACLLTLICLPLRETGW